MQHVFIIILNWNGKNNTIACLSSLQKLSHTGFEITTIVIDNASTDGSADEIKKTFPEITLLDNSENKGFAKGINQGVSYAIARKATEIVILNNDTIVDTQLIKKLLSVSQTDKKIGIVAPKIYFAQGYEFHKDRYAKEELGKVIWYAGGKMDWKNVLGYHRGVDEVDAGQYKTVETTEFASGCCMLIKKDIIEKVGFFDAAYFLYYEDNDFCQRVKKAGYTIMFAPDAVLWHKNAGSAGGSGSLLQDYFITRNRLLFGLHYANIRAKIALVRESLRLLLFGRYWQKIGVRDFYFGKFGKGSFSL